MSRETKNGAGALAVALFALATDYLFGGGDFDEVGADADDVAAFVVGAIASAATAALLFGWLVPRFRDAPAECCWVGWDGSGHRTKAGGESLRRRS